jgi:hypothetical protein
VQFALHRVLLVLVNTHLKSAQPFVTADKRRLTQMSADAMDGD